MVRKRKIWNSDKYAWELDRDLVYLSQSKELIWLVRFPTEEECDGFKDADFLEFEIDKDSSEEYVIEHTLNTKEFMRIYQKLGEILEETK